MSIIVTEILICKSISTLIMDKLFLIIFVIILHVRLGPFCMTECDANIITESFLTLREVAFISGFKIFTKDNYEKQEMGVDKAEIRRVLMETHSRLSTRPDKNPQPSKRSLRDSFKA